MSPHILFALLMLLFTVSSARGDEPAQAMGAAPTEETRRLPLVPAQESDQEDPPTRAAPPSKATITALIVVGTLIQAAGVSLLIPGIMHNGRSDSTKLLAAGSALVVGGNGMEAAGWGLLGKRNARLRYER